MLEGEALVEGKTVKCREGRCDCRCIDGLIKVFDCKRRKMKKIRKSELIKHIDKINDSNLKS